MHVQNLSLYIQVLCLNVEESTRAEEHGIWGVKNCRYANDSHIVQPCDVMAKLQVSADLFEEKEEKSDEKSEETDEKSGLKKCLRLLRSH